jgi:hypothetical protein
MQASFAGCRVGVSRLARAQRRGPTAADGAPVRRGHGDAVNVAMATVITANIRKAPSVLRALRSVIDAIPRLLRHSGSGVALRTNQSSHQNL